MTPEAFNTEYHRRERDGEPSTYNLRTNGFCCDGSDNDRIRAWLFNPSNICNCTECSHQHDILQPSRDQLPCGQYHCWVDITCNDSADD